MVFGIAIQSQRIGPIAVKHGEYNLKVMDSFHYLDIALDSRLTFSEHVTYIKSRTYSKIKLLG